MKKAEAKTSKNSRKKAFSIIVKSIIFHSGIVVFVATLFYLAFVANYISNF